MNHIFYIANHFFGRQSVIKKFGSILLTYRYAEKIHFYVIFSQKNCMSNDYLYFVAQEFAKPLNDAQMCSVF